MAVFFCTICLLAMWTLTVSHFVPTPLGRKVALLSAGALAFVWAILVIVGPPYNEGSASYAKMIERSPVLASPVARALLFGGFIFLMTYEAVEGCLLEMWTLGAGRPGKMIVHVDQYQTGSRRTCDGLEFSDAPVFLRRGVCTQYDRIADAPTRGTPVALYGPLSDFGVEVDEFEVGKPPPISDEVS